MYTMVFMLISQIHHGSLGIGSLMHVNYLFIVIQVSCLLLVLCSNMIK